MNEEIIYYIGNTRTIKFVFLDSDNGGTLDLTGGTLTFSVKIDENHNSTVIQKVTSDAAQGVITDATGGEVEFYLLAGDTSALRPDRNVYDVQLVDTNSKITTLVKGVFNLQRPIT